MFIAAAVQMRSIPGNVGENLDKGLRLLEEAALNGAGLVVFPELWTTGCVLHAGTIALLAETRDGSTITKVREAAKEFKVTVICPFAEMDGGNFYITAGIIDCDGAVKGMRRKAFLWNEEKSVFTPGEADFPVFMTAAGKIGVLICYEAEFPEPSRILALAGADLIVVPSLWSVSAAHRWDVQLPARALDNTLYVLGANSVGGSACGRSRLITPWGQVSAEASRLDEQILYGAVDYDLIRKAREEIPYLKDLREGVKLCPAEWLGRN